MPPELLVKCHAEDSTRAQWHARFSKYDPKVSLLANTPGSPSLPIDPHTLQSIVDVPKSLHPFMVVEPRIGSQPVFHSTGNFWLIETGRVTSSKNIMKRKRPR